MSPKPSVNSTQADPWRFVYLAIPNAALLFFELSGPLVAIQEGNDLEAGLYLYLLGYFLIFVYPPLGIFDLVMLRRWKKSGSPKLSIYSKISLYVIIAQILAGIGIAIWLI